MYLYIYIQIYVFFFSSIPCVFVFLLCLPALFPVMIQLGVCWGRVELQDDGPRWLSGGRVCRFLWCWKLGLGSNKYPIILCTYQIWHPNTSWIESYVSMICKENRLKGLYLFVCHCVFLWDDSVEGMLRYVGSCVWWLSILGQMFTKPSFTVVSWDSRPPAWNTNYRDQWLNDLVWFGE